MAAPDQSAQRVRPPPERIPARPTSGLTSTTADRVVYGCDEVEKRRVFEGGDKSSRSSGRGELEWVLRKSGLRDSELGVLWIDKGSGSCSGDAGKL